MEEYILTKDVGELKKGDHVVIHNVKYDPVLAMKSDEQYKLGTHFSIAKLLQELGVISLVEEDLDFNPTENYGGRNRISKRVNHYRTILCITISYHGAFCLVLDRQCTYSWRDLHQFHNVEFAYHYSHHSQVIAPSWNRTTKIN